MTSPSPLRLSASRVRAVFAHAREREMRRLHNGAMGTLLVLLVVSVFIVPAVVTYADEGKLLGDIMLTLILLTGTIAVLEHRRFTLLLASVSVITLAIRWTTWLHPDVLQPIIPEIMTIAVLVVLCSAVGINVFAPGRPITDRISGAIVLFLLVGVMWAFVYLAIDIATPAAFAGALTAKPTVFEWIYYSFVTLTTTGYGDITPVSKLARSLAILEALVGQLYPAVIIARLVSL